jgi:hypothetical protein
VFHTTQLDPAALVAGLSDAFGYPLDLREPVRVTVTVPWFRPVTSEDVTRIEAAVAQQVGRPVWLVKEEAIAAAVRRFTFSDEAPPARRDVPPGTVIW